MTDWIAYLEADPKQEPFRSIAAAWRADKARLAEAERDAARIDFLSKRMTGASDSERYLPFRVYWGDSKDARKAIDAAMEGGE